MDKITFQKLLRRTILIPVGVAAILAVTLIFAVQTFVNRIGWVERTDKVVDIADRVYRLRIDEESGLRAYLLTNHPSHNGKLRCGRVFKLRCYEIPKDCHDLARLLVGRIVTAVRNQTPFEILQPRLA